MKNHDLFLRFKTWLLKLASIRDEPAKIAGGAAIGIFLGIFPGLGVIASVLLATYFKRNSLAAIAGSLVTNTWVSIFLIPLVIWLLQSLLGLDTADTYQLLLSAYRSGDWLTLFKLSLSHLALPFIATMIALSALIASLSYFIILKLLVHFRKNKVK